MFGIKKNGWSIKEFCKELEKTITQKPYGLPLAYEVFHMFCGFFRDKADCVACYACNDREIFFGTTLPEDEAAFYRKDFQKRSENDRIKECKIVRVSVENGALCGMWVLEIHSEMAESLEDSFREMVTVVQTAVTSCLFAEEWKKEQMRDCVTGLLGNAAFEQALQRFMEQGREGHLIAARRLVRYGRPYGADGMNRSIQMLAGACKRSGIPDVYRISEDTVALLCLDGQERAYATAQEIADIGETDLYVAEFATVEKGEVYFLIQQNLDGEDEGGQAFGLHYPYPKLPIYKDDPEGGRDGK